MAQHVREGGGHFATRPIVSAPATPLDFDEATHVFTRGGVRVPSVTQCIAACGLIDPRTTTSEWARDRGRRVHRAVYLLTTESEDAALSVLEPDDVPYFEAAQWWMASSGVEVFAAEELVDAGSYAGWRDIRCKIRGVSDPAVVDLKSGSLPLWAGIQLAAYAAPLPVRHARVAVRLQLNGEPRVKIYTEPGDWFDFRVCLRAWQLQAHMVRG